jgi:excisionase family DNA binding protein
MSSRNSVPVDAVLYTVPEAAEILRLSVSAIRAWILQRQIPFVKLHNKAVRIRRADVDALIAASLVPAKKDAA